MERTKTPVLFYTLFYTQHLVFMTYLTLAFAQLLLVKEFSSIKHLAELRCGDKKKKMKQHKSFCWMVVFVPLSFLWLNDISPNLLWPPGSRGQEIERLVTGGQIEKAVYVFVGQSEKRGEKRERRNTSVSAFLPFAPGLGDLWLCVF